ncbi:hypothetical protein POY55_16715, partial [Phocaeicola vulgatus]|nr:hypothetical protein [Phocaeicola vulgatus]MDC1557676.1 hypothetical protein [Phocaeicola vulgatus]MDC1561915.1 hypothetical protein [Phocaeicola vulgatus]
MNTLEILFFVLLFIVFYTYVGYGILLWILVKIKQSFIGSPDKPGGLSIQLCKSEKKEFYIRYS